jgi:hypothetical protein
MHVINNAPPDTPLAVFKFSRRDPMSNAVRSSSRLRSISALLALSAVACTALPAAAETCVRKAGEGTNTTVDGAKFQAWEAVLQATDWSVWSAMMATKQAVGVAPGMKVSGVSTSCKPGGLGQICKAQATLCR